MRVEDVLGPKNLKRFLESESEDLSTIDAITYGKDSRHMWHQINDLRESLPQVWKVLYTMACKMQDLERKFDEDRF